MSVNKIQNKKKKSKITNNMEEKNMSPKATNTNQTKRNTQADFEEKAKKQKDNDNCFFMNECMFNCIWLTFNLLHIKMLHYDNGYVSNLLNFTEST